MATVTITITDKEDGEVNVNAKFDPEIKKGEDGTPAQHAAVAALNGVMRHAAKSDPDFDEDEDAEWIGEEDDDDED